jgi:hypothetical protein
MNRRLVRKTDYISLAVKEYDLLGVLRHGRDSLPEWTVLACSGSINKRRRRSTEFSTASSA